MAKCHLKINVYHSSDYISFLIFVYGVYNLFTNFGNMSQKTKCQNCVKQRNPAETKDSGCQKTHKIHTCPDRYLIGRKKTVDPIDGNLSQYCPNAEIHDHPEAAPDLSQPRLTGALRPLWLSPYRKETHKLFYDFFHH